MPLPAIRPVIPRARPRVAGRVGRRPCPRAACPDDDEAGHVGLGWGDRVQQGQQQLRIVGVRRGDQDGQWYATAVAQYVDLRTGFATVDRVWPGSLPPFSARTLIESATARDQSISLITPSRCRNAWCSRSHNPACVHSVNRRCADARLTPNNAVGNLCQEHPAWTRYTIAASTARSSTRRFPPPCRGTAGTGINGCATCQKSSGAQVRTISSTTKRRSCRRSTLSQVRHALKYSMSKDAVQQETVRPTVRRSRDRLRTGPGP